MTQLLLDLLARMGSLVIDGAMSTALENAGYSLKTRLWTAAALIDAPEKVRDVHRSYFDAGADITITDSYQATEAGFADAGIDSEQAATLIALSVKLAREARHDWAVAASGRSEDDKLVAGSCGPYGAYVPVGAEYTGAYHLSRNEYENFHRLRINALIDAHADLLALETQPRLEEIEAELSLVKKRNAACWVTVTLADDGAHMPDGTALEALASELDRISCVVAFGVNCCAPSKAEAALLRMKPFTEKPLVIYPNTGHFCHGPLAPADWKALVTRWLHAGARCIGSCCGTSTEDTAAIAEALHTFLSDR
ncbi:MAG: Homocysteine S-methyltransferase [Burkholderia sp.]|jgi:homocysteine S-methyltransferase